MRKIIAALQITLDGIVEGPNGEVDWVDAWEDRFGLSSQIDGCILGGGMYPGYEEYWTSVIENPRGILPQTGKVASAGELRYAQYAATAPHFIVSRRLEKAAWKNARIIRDLDEIRALKQQPGKHLHALGGATLIGSLMNANLIDEFRLVVHPVVLGGGKALFKDVRTRRALRLADATRLQSGMVRLIYNCRDR